MWYIHFKLYINYIINIHTIYYWYKYCLNSFILDRYIQNYSYYKYITNLIFNVYNINNYKHINDISQKSIYRISYNTI